MTLINLLLSLRSALRRDKACRRYLPCSWRVIASSPYVRTDNSGNQKITVFRLGSRPLVDRPCFARPTGRGLAGLYYKIATPILAIRHEIRDARFQLRSVVCIIDQFCRGRIQADARSGPPTAVAA